MPDALDLVIRNGLVFDGEGGEPVRADVAVRDGKIVVVGEIGTHGREEINAAGCIVTPGFIDLHTHYDGQAIWSSSMTPSSLHGVTTVVVGNCGVGFAPCRPEDRDLLVETMEGVEDIPEAVMTAGLPWDWETFPDFMGKLDSLPRDIDVAALLPHSALRVNVMGERGAAREPATPADLARMAEITREAIAAGAIGFGTSRTFVDRRANGEFIPSFGASEEELITIAAAMDGKGIMQILLDLTQATDEEMRREVAMIGNVSQQAGVMVTFTLAQVNPHPDRWRNILEWTDEENRRPGVSIRPQVFPRPTGIIIGHNLTANPFSLCPSYLAIADLPLEERVIELRKTEVRARIVREQPTDPRLPLVGLARAFDRTYLLTDPPNYEPPAETSIASIARAQGISPEELAYDLLLQDEGHAMLYVAFANYANGNLDHAFEMMRHPETVVGLGDGGAHYGMICDASYPTFMLSYWARDRQGARISLSEAVAMLTSSPARVIGFTDRGLLRPGYKADINVIDHERLKLHRPVVSRDLPSGGRRLHQTAEGYRATIVDGQVVSRGDRLTGELPGRLVRNMHERRVLEPVA